MQNKTIWPFNSVYLAPLLGPGTGPLMPICLLGIGGSCGTCVAACLATVPIPV
jgi:hypothetical protein